MEWTECEEYARDTQDIAGWSLGEDGRTGCARVGVAEDPLRERERINMDINWRGADWSPIYWDPEPGEMLALTRSFDTLRVGFKLEKGFYHLVIASGLGNTHSTLSRALGEMNPRCKPNREGIKFGGLDGWVIIYYECNRLWFNMEDYSGNERTPWRQAVGQLPCSDQLKEICRLAVEQQELMDE